MPCVQNSAEVQAWRDGYKRHLLAHGVPLDQAADMSVKVAYRPDLYRVQADVASEVKPNEARLIKTATEIALEPPTGDDMGFTHTVLCQVGLPRSKVAGREFLRQSGSAWLNVQAGMLDEGRGPVLQPIPYGAMPRLALTWVSTYAKRHNTREIPAGNSAAEFLRSMDMDAQGAYFAQRDHLFRSIVTAV